MANIKDKITNAEIGRHYKLYRKVISEEEKWEFHNKHATHLVYIETFIGERRWRHTPVAIEPHELKYTVKGMINEIVKQYNKEL